MSVPVVRNVSPLKIGMGMPVVVTGVGFGSSTKVLIGSVELPVLDYDDNSLTFSAPSSLGVFALSVANGSDSVSFAITVEKIASLDAWNLALRGTDEFRHAFVGLMPRGFAWYMGKDGNWWKLFSALAEGFLSVYEMFRSLVVEADPSMTSAFNVWEYELGLPIKGLERDSSDGRRDEIFRIARKAGDNTVPYFRSLAALFGTSVNVYEYWKNPEKFDGVNFGDDDPNFYWMVEIDARIDDWNFCTCNDSCNDYLAWWWNGPLESLFDNVKPAHTKVLYSYVYSEPNYYLLTQLNEMLLTENFEAILYGEPDTVNIDGREYRTVSIGNRTWLAENLDLKAPGIEVGSSSASGSVPLANYYDNDEATYGADGNKYGLLYNWPAVQVLENLKSSLFPGWHVATREDFNDLLNAVEGTISEKSAKLRSVAWFGGTDDYGFSAEPSGERYYATGAYRQVGTNTNFWTSTSMRQDRSWRMYVTSAYVGINVDYNQYQWPVRLVKDN